MKYFMNVNTLEELKAEYRRLVKLHHPDCGGDTATMQEINNEHDALFEILKARHNEKAANDETGKTRATTETPEEFRTIIEALLKLDGIEAELIGSWIWIGGNTKQHKEQLKAIGCRWSNNKKMWYWHHAEAGSKWHRGNKTIQEIRGKYGSYKIKAESETIATA